jgi:hypothetical protein
MDTKVIDGTEVIAQLNHALVNIEAVLDIVQWGSEADKKHMLLTGAVRGHAEKVQKALRAIAATLRTG